MTHAHDWRPLEDLGYYACPCGAEFTAPGLPRGESWMAGAATIGS